MPEGDIAFTNHFKEQLLLGAVDMATGIDELVAAGCEVLVDDITYLTEPFFMDGVVSQAGGHSIEGAGQLTQFVPPWL